LSFPLELIVLGFGAWLYARMTTFASAKGRYVFWGFVVLLATLQIYANFGVGTKLGIHDKGGMQFSATGDPTQEDCADVSTNTTSYLLVMQANGMLKHHTVDATMSKANLGKGLMTLNPVKYWPHWSAILKEKESGQKYAVDRWPFDQGENAAVVKVEDWYIKDRE
jgi:hypothetical protein